MNIRLIVLHACTFVGGIALFSLLFYCATRASPETVWIIGAISAVLLGVLIYVSVSRDKQVALMELAGELGKAGVAITQARGGVLGGMLGFGTAPMAPAELPPEDER